MEYLDAEGQLGEGVFGRRFQFCPTLKRQAQKPSDLILTCPRCLDYAARCCHHVNFESEQACHHYRLVFTDGACLSNGQSGATAGIGIAMGELDGRQWSVPIDNSIDSFPKRSSQRAELLAAIHALRFLSETRIKAALESPHGHRQAIMHQDDVQDRECWVVTTDSEYVVKGITEWFPQWKANGWRNVQGRRPGNLDLFMVLDEEIIAQERRHRVDIGFWHIPREFNRVADSLAKAAAHIAPALSSQ
ncbi:hypothetical protein CERSUDRAFT_103428 [Gelatoporia subvermispora B]|uniref:ribonuclease H n=1 Tax=Ceriporiopsis subvermispora (strain B) TaxID=914234 RepID=M2QVG3_CERS8|nr:hypothetical protein CERSUDRAFT_103428 [Gelatoporia subvermispora B]